MCNGIDVRSMGFDDEFRAFADSHGRYTHVTSRDHCTSTDLEREGLASDRRIKDLAVCTPEASGVMHAHLFED